MAIRFGISVVLVLLAGPALAAAPVNTPTPAEAKAMLNAAAGSGELHYSFFNPATRLIEPKVSFLAKAGDDVCGVGTYDSKK